MTFRLPLLSHLLDAFVDVVEPVARRLLPKGRLVVTETEAGFALTEVVGGRVTPLGPLETAAAGTRRLAVVELRLDPERLLTRSLTLPAGGRDYVEPILEHRLERLTPWRPDKVLYGYALAGAPAADGSLAVDFAATSEDVARTAAERLAAHGLVPTALGSAAEPVERPLRIDLYRGRRSLAGGRLRRGAAIAIAAAFALLLPGLAASVLLLEGAQARLDALETRLVAKRKAVRLAVEGGDAAGRDRELIAEKRPEGAVMVLIDRLSAALPDDTVLDELSVEGGRLRLAGQSADAPRLIGLLEQDSAAADVTFAAPVTRTEQGLDRFDIVARWEGGAAGGGNGDAAPATAPDTVAGGLP